MEGNAKPTPEELAVLGQVIRQIIRTRHLSPPDAQDFTQSVYLRFVERGNDIFAQFAGRSTLRTYLTIVVTRLLMDWRNRTQGKWRPTAAAIRLGPHAIELDRLINRDGFDADVAIEVLRSRPDAPAAAELSRIADLLPRRPQRRQVSEDDLQSLSRPFDDVVDAEERRRTEVHARRTLAAALRQLPREDRWLVRERFFRRHSVHAIASVLQVDEKQLYRRFDRTLRSLRRVLAEAGVTSAMF